jgi:hypothetical protein
MEPANPSDRDDMGPPAEPCECFCLHCRRVFMSDQMWFQKVINSKDGFPGFWMCPTPNCGGAGFQMDIFPTDPDHPANAGWTSFDDDDDDDDESDEDEEWDPDEPQYAEQDEFEDEDIEGEEWKYGKSPADVPIVQPELTEEQCDRQAEAQREHDEEEKRYDMPDERPRIIDWSNREDPPPMNLDDIPF